MPYNPLPASFHAANRKKLADSIGPDAVAIIDTADVLSRGDFEYPFWPDANFYYLTGIDEPEAVLVLVPGQSDPGLREILFLSGTSDLVATWEGERLTPERAASLSGIHRILPLSDLDRIMDNLAKRYGTIYLNSDDGLTSHMPHPGMRRALLYREQLPTHQLKSVVPMVARLRQVKAGPEIEQIRRSIATTHKGLKAAWATIARGSHEYDLEAALSAEYLRTHGSRHGFYPIVASGPNTTVMHHMKSDRRLAKQDLLLIDTGAQTGWYTADITRTVPVSGHFTPRQQALYEAVLAAQQEAFRMTKPGESVLSIDERMRQVLTEGLKKLGVMKQELAGSDAEKALRLHYAHISHHLGLDVHEPISPRAILEPGMVITCEPGLYLKEEGMGVRIEDDLLITETGYELLSSDIPRELEAIEHALEELAI